MFSHSDLVRLNDLEMQVYQFIIKHREGVSYMTIRELAEQAGVSTTTVLRFCRKMGCEGWSEFRIRLRLNEQQSAPMLNTAGVSEMLSFFKSINNPEFEQLIAEAAQKINQAERVFFIGVGTAIDDPYYPVSPDLYENAIALILSVSGETEEILRIASQFSLNKCKIIAITNTESCSLAKIGDFNLCYHVPIIRMADNSDITTQVPVTYIIEAIGRQLGK